MTFSEKGTIAAALVGATMLLSIAPVSASPLVSGSSMKAIKSQSDNASVVTDVRHRRGNAGAAFARGVAGAIIGGIIASQARPYPDYYYPYYAPYPAYGGGIAYCARRFRSYDPYSMTYLGTDGYRHPCP